MKVLLCLMVLCFVSPDSCDTSSQTSSAPKVNTAPESSSLHFQRFIPISHPQNLKGEQWKGTYALDTETGQICLTFNPSDSGSVSAIPSCKSLSGTQLAPDGTRVKMADGSYQVKRDGKWVKESALPVGTVKEYKGAKYRFNGGYWEKLAQEPPPKMIRAVDPKGKMYEAPAGTPLPKGWKLKESKTK